MPKISVIIPVYRAERTLRRCVESIVFGEEQDLEIILIEDCSKDGSWALCLQLAQEYSQVVCLQNDRNRGVSYTRNRGLDAATGQYLLFVDSDDWVSRSYAKALVTAAEKNPGKLIVCGFTSIDHTKENHVLRRDYCITDTAVLSRCDFNRLTEKVMFQELWNKVFCINDLRKAGIRFNETICVGEDFQFVMDAVEALDIEECVIIPKPLYYYIRSGSGSLMDQWVKNESYDDALNRALRMETLCRRNSNDTESFKCGYVYRILRERSMSQKEKIAIAQQVLGKEKGRRFYCRQSLIYLREQLVNMIGSETGIHTRLLGKLRPVINKCKIRSAAKGLKIDDVTVISQNQIGTAFCHDMEMPCLSPTVNLYFPAADFIRFVTNLEHYRNAELKLMWGEEYPLGMLDDVQIHFVHYDTCQQAWDDWERRKKKMNMDRIVVLSTDRDGFDGTLFESWKAIPYPKLLFTACKAYAEHEDALYFSKYQSAGCVPDLIPKREFYRKKLLIKKVNQLQ